MKEDLALEREEAVEEKERLQKAVVCMLWCEGLLNRRGRGKLAAPSPPLRVGGVVSRGI